MEKKSNNRVAYNGIAALCYQFITIIANFVLPRCILTFYGSAVNGLVSSILQFLSFISFMELGVGAVVQSALYKPLAENDNDSISRIMASASRFFKKIALVLLAYVFILMIVYPQTQRTFDYIYTASLIAIISISYFAEYYFGLTYQLLLSADQKAYIYLIVQSIAVIINTLLCYIAIHMGASIHIIKLTTSIIYIIRPVLIYIYVKRHYKINTKIKYHGEPIKQKWNGLAQHLASVVLSSTDICVLTLFSTLENVSIYSVYALITNGVKQLVSSFTTGLMSWFGEMIAKDNIDELNRRFDFVEWLLHTLIVFLFTVCAVLIIPFVNVYCYGIIDTNYNVPLFAILLTLATASHSLRVPYNMIVMAAGHFKETQKSAIIEMSLNIIISILLVKHYGLIGVAIGTFISMTYRTIYFVFYLKNNIVKRSTLLFFKHVIIDLITVMLIVIATYRLQLSNISYFAWTMLAIKVSIIAICIIVLLNFIFYKKYLMYYIRVFERKFKCENKQS